MNIRLSILFILCVVVPTSALSLMAAISVRRWEAVAAARQEREAVRLVRAARSAVDDGLRGALARVRERLAVSLAAGKTGDEMRVQATRAELDSPFVDRVFVFMNPWGFVHPGEGNGGHGAANSPDMAALEAAIRRELATAGRTDWMPFQVGDQSYAFGAMGEGRGLYVGFSVLQEVAVAAARSAAPSGGDMQVVVLRSLDEVPRAEGDVVVSDPLGGAIRLGEEDEGIASKGVILAEARLAAPLRHVAVRVLGTAAQEGREAASIRMRLQLWGIVLLGAGVLAGVGVTLRALWSDLRRSRNQADLVLGVSHDLRTPAASIRALAESLCLGRVTEPDKQKRFLDSILREAERLAHLTERALYLLRFEQGAIAMARRSVDLGSLVEEALNLFRQRRGLAGNPSASCCATGRVGRTNVTVRWTIPRDAMCIEGDASALLQTISNLLDNAWQYTVGPRLAGAGAGAQLLVPDAPVPSLPPGSGVEGEWEARDRSGLPPGVRRQPSPASSGVGEQDVVPSLAVADALIEIEVELAVERTVLKRRDGVRIVVADNGIGLKPAERRRLFRRFYRAPAARRLHASGVGLGLAFCRYVIEAHGGSIKVNSEFGKGAEFTIWLPGSKGEEMGGRGRESLRRPK